MVCYHILVSDELALNGDFSVVGLRFVERDEPADPVTRMGWWTVEDADGPPELEDRKVELSVQFVQRAGDPRDVTYNLHRTLIE
jgi:hypothetical protein